MPWLATRTRSATTITARREALLGDHAAHQHTPHQGEHPRGQHEPDVCGGAANFQHRERERHGDHAIAQDGHCLPGEEQPKLAPVQYIEAVAQARHEGREVRRTQPVRDGLGSR